MLPRGFHLPSLIPHPPLFGVSDLVKGENSMHQPPCVFQLTRFFLLFLFSSFYLFPSIFFKANPGYGLVWFRMIWYGMCTGDSGEGGFFFFPFGYKESKKKKMIMIFLYKKKSKKKKEQNKTKQKPNNMNNEFFF